MGRLSVDYYERREQTSNRSPHPLLLPLQNLPQQTTRRAQPSQHPSRRNLQTPRQDPIIVRWHPRASRPKRAAGDRQQRAAEVRGRAGDCGGSPGELDRITHQSHIVWGGSHPEHSWLLAQFAGSGRKGQPADRNHRQQKPKTRHSEIRAGEGNAGEPQAEVVEQQNALWVDPNVVKNRPANLAGRPRKNNHFGGGFAPKNRDDRWGMQNSVGEDSRQGNYNLVYQKGRSRGSDAGEGEADTTLVQPQTTQRASQRLPTKTQLLLQLLQRTKHPVSHRRYAGQIARA